MATPLKRDREQFDDSFEEQEITTADLAQGKRPISDTRGPQVVPPGLGTPQVISTSEADMPTIEAKAEPRAEADEPLFPREELRGLRTRWKEIQTAFVDEPRSAVEKADGLVASAMKRLAEVFAEERSQLEKQWDRGEGVSTENLRVALQRYRAFFDRLLSV